MVGELGRLGQGLAPDAAAGAPAAHLNEPLVAPRYFTLTVPATSANLGPGYDTAGLALDLRDTIEVQASPRRDPDRAEVAVTVTGEGSSDLPADASHLVISVVERILAAKGFALPDMHVTAHNVIPHSRGLGSSAAAIATAVVTADQLLPDGLSADEQLQIGSRIEGHPDNYVPALRGGVSIAWHAGEDSNGASVFRAAALRHHPELRCVVAVPDFVQSTQTARDLLPVQIPHGTAAKNSSRAALLTHALTEAPELLLDATEDFLHQEYRRQAFPASMALLDSLRQAGYAAVISGAGPAVLVLTTRAEATAVAEHIRSWDAEQTTPKTFTARNLPIARSGATVETHQR
ncbi:homoserine kinase [Nesterenkonia alba]|uniref:homoserine kinase n=1 Tax=Nesterenkonia alba TaxID=515814 RepID=UPI0003B4E7AC|nr:homoserine kinase [Nesterenkonia alba]